jgi:hypothetical protein
MFCQTVRITRTWRSGVELTACADTYGDPPVYGQVQRDGACLKSDGVPPFGHGERTDDADRCECVVVVVEPERYLTDRDWLRDAIYSSRV